MKKDKKKPHGHTYRANNSVNDKNYVGQTVDSRWPEGKNPIEERWKEEVGDAYRKEARGENLRIIERAVIKYGPENFELYEHDVAYSQSELDDNETRGIKEYDTMNPDKGYNMKEGGRGGRLSEQAKENLSNIITEKYNTDSEYYNKQVEERRERAKDPQWIEKMTEINRERAKDPQWINKMAEVNQEINRNPETQAKISEKLVDTWQNKEYQQKVSEGVSQTWQDPESREKYFKSKAEGKREIEDKEQFLKDIQEMKKKDINTKYEMDGKSINKRIEEMLGHKGVRTYSEVKKYLENKNLNDVLSEINQPEKTTVRKDIPNIEEFLKDIQKMQKKDVNEKYGLNGSTVNKKLQEMLGDRGVHTYTDAKKYLANKEVKEVVDDINERLNQTERNQGTTNIIDKKEFLKDIQNMKKYEISHKYGMGGKTINRRIEEILGGVGVKNYSQAKDYLDNKDIDEILKDTEKLNKEKPEFHEEDLKDKEESKSQENIKEKTDENPKSEQKEELEEKPNEEKKDDKSEKPLENPEGTQNEESSEKDMGEKEEKSEEIEENVEPIDKKDIDKDSSKTEEERNEIRSEENLSMDSPKNEDTVKDNENFENLDNMNLTSIDYDGIDKDSTETKQDLKGFINGHDWESSESMDHVDDKSNEFDDFKGLGEDQGRGDSEFIKSLDPHAVNKEFNESNDKEGQDKNQGGTEGGNR